MSEQTDREAILREVAKKKVVYQLPGMEDLPVRRDLTYRATSSAELSMDLYYPSQPDRPFPLAIMPMAYPDPAARIRAYGPLTSWARLIAASGVAAVVYGTESPEEDVHALLQHLRADASTLSLDVNRFGVFALSANVTIGLATLMQDRSIRCAALLYGYTMDQDGSTVVADAVKQFGFVNACAGRTVADLPADVPMMFVRAGREHFPGLNEALDKFIGRALVRNLPVSFVNHATGRHGFDLDEDTVISRGIVQQVLSFLRLHLGVES